MSYLTHPVCDECFLHRMGPRTPVRYVERPEETCCGCSKLMRSGIYLRGHPREFAACTHKLPPVDDHGFYWGEPLQPHCTACCSLATAAYTYEEPKLLISIGSCKDSQCRDSAMRAGLRAKEQAKKLGKGAES